MLNPEQIQQATPSQLITLEEAARRIGRNKKTVQNWIYTKALGGKQGLCYVGRKNHSTPMIDWDLFGPAFIKRAA